MWRKCIPSTGYTSSTIFLPSTFPTSQPASCVARLTTSGERPYTLESGRTSQLVLVPELHMCPCTVCTGILVGSQSSSAFCHAEPPPDSALTLYYRDAQTHPFFHKRDHILRQPNTIDHQHTVCVPPGCTGTERSRSHSLISTPKEGHSSKPVD